MTTHATTIRAASPRSASPRTVPWLLLGAPCVAILAGVSAQWLDFRALRVPLLLLVGCGVLATAYATNGVRRDWRAALTTVAIGAATWAAAQGVYAIIHIAAGERFHADRFGAQWLQAIALIAAHGAFLGVPTGIVAAIILRVAAMRSPSAHG